MSITYTLINSLDDIDYDDLYERSKDVVELNWPAASPIQGNDIKVHIGNMITSGMNNEWPGLNLHVPTDTPVLFKSEESDTGLLVGLVFGYITEDGTLDGRHSFSTHDSSGSRSFIYAAETIQNREQFYRDIGITKVKYNNIPDNSSLYRVLKLRETAGYFTILSDEESQPGFRTIVTQPNL